MTLLDADEKQRKGVLGEDTCELLATIEDSFGIRFPDYEAALGKSVWELAEYISNASEYPKADRCLSAVAFYRLRRAFRELFDTPRDMIRPATSLDILLPWSSRRVRWRRLQHQLDLALPALTYPVWLLGLSLTITVASSIALSIAMKEIFGLRLALMGVVFGSFFLWICVLICLTPLAKAIPGECETFGGLVRAVLARNYATFASKYGGTSQDQITSLLCQLIAVEVGIKPTEITPDTHIRGDLNIE